jgi:alkaline phosphatase
MKTNIIVLMLLLLFTVTIQGQEKKFEGVESSYKNQDFYEVQTFSHKFKSKRPKNVIFMIGDGMGVAQVFAGATANKGNLYLNNFKHVGFSRTQSANRYVTDSAAGGTALAIGHKTNNSTIGMDAEGNTVSSIIKLAKENNLATGIVVTTSILDATPAAFAAHQITREMIPEIAADFVNADLDIFIGGGIEHFNNREDGRNLLDELTAKGYQVVETLPEVVKINKGKLAGFIKESRVDNRGEQLKQTTAVALDILDEHKKGFFLMVEASEIDGGGHDNDMKYTVEEMLDFDKAIGKVLEFAAKDGETLVVVTADHETGGLTLVGGDLKTGEVRGRFTTKGHTGIMVPVFAYGPGAEYFAGIDENTSFFDKFVKVLRLKK